MADSDDHQANGWHLKCHRLFLDRYESLIQYVEDLAENDPLEFQHHPAFKLLAAVAKAVEEQVPADPNHRDFLCATLGHGGRWRRVKRGLPSRYRLFFQFNSTHRTIIYVWLNDEATLRHAGAKSDVYAIFLKMTSKGVIVSTFDQLLEECEDLPKSGTEDD